MSTNSFYQGTKGGWPTMSVSNSGLVLPTQVPFRTGLGNTDVTDQSEDENYQSPWEYWGDSGIVTPCNPIWNAKTASVDLSPNVKQLSRSHGRLQNVRY